MFDYIYGLTYNTAEKLNFLFHHERSFCLYYRPYFYEILVWQNQDLDGNLQQF